jgi:hypothetical protein
MFGKFRNALFGPAENKICSIINFCTHDYRFLRTCVEQAGSFSEQILVAYSDHFFDAVPENSELLEKAKAENPEARFVKLPFDASAGKNQQYWVTLSRWNALQEVDEDISWILFLDADEIVDSRAFAEALPSMNLAKNQMLKLANYYYFRESKFRAHSLEDSVTLVRKSLLTREMVLDYQDRHKAWELISGPKERMFTGKGGLPLVHHFSWVRTREEMLRKVKSWGHAGERNWEKLVMEEFSRPFSGKDFVHGYDYESVAPPFPSIGL